MTTTLLLIRHAVRAPNSKTSDRDCPISEEGRQATARLSEKIKNKFAISAILYSPTRRTEETAEIIAKYFDLEAAREQALYFGQDEELLFQKLPDPALNESVIFVGHGPALELFATLAIGKALPVNHSMRESTALILEFPSEVGPKKGRFIGELNSNS